MSAVDDLDEIDRIIEEAHQRPHPREVKNWRGRPWAPPLTPKQMDAWVQSDDMSAASEEKRLRAEITAAPRVFVEVREYTDVIWNGINFSMPKSGEYPKPVADLYLSMQQQIADQAPPQGDQPYSTWEKWLTEQGVNRTKRRRPEPTTTMLAKFEKHHRDFEREAVHAHLELSAQDGTMPWSHFTPDEKLKLAKSIIDEAFKDMGKPND